ncbi:MAG: hypothetical protein PHI19_07365 [Clostridia bacterium]|nr:hypothetical protein [Clostridia bacterium]
MSRKSRRFDEDNSSVIVEENRRFYTNRTVRFALANLYAFALKQ